MISHEYKCIFIHIPKCAGTSIEKALGHFDVRKVSGMQDHRTIRALQPKIHLIHFKHNKENYTEGLRYFKHKIIKRSSVNHRNLYTVNNEQFSSYFKFTVVRNPWDRVVSVYKNIVRDPLHQKRLGITNVPEFKDFLKKYLGKNNALLRPQIDYLKGFSGNIQMDYIARFENLEEEFKFIGSRIGMKDISLPHETKSPNRKQYKDYYADKSSIKIVEDYYREDIELFNYRFDE